MRGTRGFRPPTPCGVAATLAWPRERPTAPGGHRRSVVGLGGRCESGPHREFPVLETDLEDCHVDVRSRMVARPV
eukprot:872364-Prymnesium_polylepis.1